MEVIFTIVDFVEIRYLCLCDSSSQRGLGSGHIHLQILMNSRQIGVVFYKHSSLKEKYLEIKSYS